ncbi:hypothetical protein D5272_16615 [bacterium D16-76]|nr:hypothetical protein [bacterium D16-76]
MAAKATQTSRSAPKAVHKSGRILCYIGPNIPGRLHTGQVFRGERAEVMKELSGTVEKYPLVKTLLVSGEALPVARLKVKEPGNAHYANYQKLHRALLEEAQNKVDKEALLNA